MKIYVVGLGPGGDDFITPQARKAIEISDTVVGYTVYTDLIAHLTEGKKVLSTGMTRETERCRLALSEACEGKTVAFVCSGDSGVYGMAGIMLEIARDNPEIEIEIVAGVTAACSGAALLGAPLIHDFAVISLSDLLTDWSKIEKRLECAALSDFVICLYNPRSKKRADYLNRACNIVSSHLPPTTPCGYVKNIGRDGEKAVILTLRELSECTDIDMFTTVFIGNSSTKIVNGRLVTPRGYKDV